MGLCGMGCVHDRARWGSVGWAVFMTGQDGVVWGGRCS